MLAIASQFKTDLDTAIALGFGAFRFERAGSTIGAFVKPALREVAVLGFVRLGFHEEHTFLCRADEFILFLIVGKIVGLETQFFHPVWLAGWVLFLMEGVVLEEIAHLFLL